MYGAIGESSSKRLALERFAPNGEFDDTCTKRDGTRRRPVEHELRAADVDVEELAHRGSDGSPPPRGTPTRPDALEQLVDDRRVAHVAGDDLDPAGRPPPARRRVAGLVHEATDASPRRLRGKRPYEVLTEPAGGAGDDNAVGRCHSSAAAPLRFAIADGLDAIASAPRSRPLSGYRGPLA